MNNFIIAQLKVNVNSFLKGEIKLQKIGERLKQLRKREGYTQKQLSELLEFQGNSYSSYEYNRIKPSIEKFIKLAEILHTSVQYIVTGKELSIEFQKNVSLFPQRLRELRAKKQLTQVAVANILNIEEVTYQHYEYGAYEPKLDKLLQLAEVFDVTLDELMGRNRK